MEHVDPQGMEKERLQKLLEEKPNDSRPKAARPDMAVRGQPVRPRESLAIFHVDEEEKFRAAFKPRERPHHPQEIAIDAARLRVQRGEIDSDSHEARAISLTCCSISPSIRLSLKQARARA
jgi:hypothetical protein